MASAVTQSKRAPSATERPVEVNFQFTTEGRVAQVYKELESYTSDGIDVSMGVKKYVAKLLTLADLQALQEEKRTELTARLGLTEVVATVDQCFRERMKITGPSVLSLVPLPHLYEFIEEPARESWVTSECCHQTDKKFVQTPGKKAIAMEDSLVYLAFASDEAIAQISVQSLAKNFKEVPPVLYLRLKNLQTLCQKSDYAEASVAQMAFLSPKEIEQRASSLPDLAFTLVSDEQLKGLDFSKLTPGQIMYALRDPLADTPEAISYKFGLLSEEQTEIVFAKVDDLPRFLPEGLYARLPLSKMRKKQIEAIFPHKSEPQFKIIDKRHLQTIPAAELALALGHLSYWQTRLLSEDQVNAIGRDKLRNAPK